jgi:hypothetical protein
MKKAFLLLLVLPFVAVAQQKTVSPLKIDAGDGQNAALTIVATNQYAPLIAVNNGTTSILTVSSNGVLTMSSTNGQFVFGATNSAPATTNTVSAWVTVSVANNTNTYKLPLYR